MDGEPPAEPPAKRAKKFPEKPAKAAMSLADAMGKLQEPTDDQKGIAGKGSKQAALTGVVGLKYVGPVVSEAGVKSFLETKDTYMKDKERDLAVFSVTSSSGGPSAVQAFMRLKRPGQQYKVLTRELKHEEVAPEVKDMKPGHGKLTGPLREEIAG